MERKDLDIPNSSGIISFNRVQGDVDLYGSPIKCQGFITLRIYEAYEQRNLSRFWRGAKRTVPVMEVRLSHHQFAEAITCMNGSETVPCTIYSVNGEMREDPVPVEEIPIFQEEFKNSLKGVSDRIDSTLDFIDSEDTKVSQKVKKALRKRLEGIKMQLEENVPFVESQFTRRIEKVQQVMKTEFYSFTESIIRSTGLKNLLGSGDD